MKKLVISRTNVLRLTWRLVRKAGFTFAQALKQAWGVVRLWTQMHRESVSFFYLKENGEERFAVGTYLTDELVAMGHFPPKDNLAITYYDTLAGGWRSFRADRLVIC